MACTVIRRSYLRLFSAVFLLAFWLSVPAASAQTRNTLSVPSVVVDAVGGAIPGARVTASDINGAVGQTTTADAAGAVSLGGLAPGTYSVLVEMHLFSPITLRVTVPDSGSVSALRAVLKAGGFTESVVVTGRRVETRLSETPQKIEVIDATDIERSVAADLTDVLKKNSGVDVVQYTGALSGVGLRGFRPQISGINKRSLLLIDGRPSGVTNVATLLLDNVERIEVLKGAASAVYGSSAMGGVINVITRQSRGKVGGNVRIGPGSFGATECAGRVGGRASPNVDFDATANVFDQRDDIRMGNGVTRPATSYKTYDGGGRLGVTLHGGWRLDGRTDFYRGRDISTPARPRGWGGAGPSMGGVSLDIETVREQRREGARAQGSRARVVRKVADSIIQLLPLLSPNAVLLAVGVVADIAVGDPVYAWHPVRLIGGTLTWMEGRLREAGLDGYGGGVLLFAGLAAVSLGVLMLVSCAAHSLALAWLIHLFLLYSLLALGDLLQHVSRIETAVRAGDLPRARLAVTALVGRDTDRMDGGACRRAAVESLSENLTDGFVSPVFWYVLAGCPASCFSRLSAPWTRWSGTRLPVTSASVGAAQDSMTS